MKAKPLLIAVALLAAAALAVHFTRRPSGPASANPDARNGQPLLDAATVEKVAQIRLTENGKPVTLAKSTDNLWRVTSYYDYNADFSQLSQLIDNLTEAKIDRFVTAQPDRLKRLEFKDPSVVLLDSAGSTVWSLTLGKTSETGTRFIRFGNEEKAYATRLNLNLDPESKNWADSALFPLKSDQIASLEISFPNAPAFTATRPNKDAPYAATNPPAGQQLKVAALTSLVHTLNNLRFSETTATDDPNALAARAHARTIKATTFDGKTLTVTLGRKPEEKKIKAPTPIDPTKAVQDLVKPDAPKPENPATAAVETETIPAGPVFAFITHSDSSDPINTQMQKRAHQIFEYTYTDLPATPETLLEPAPTKPTEPAKEPASK